MSAYQPLTVQAQSPQDLFNRGLALCQAPDAAASQRQEAVALLRAAYEAAPNEISFAWHLAQQLVRLGLEIEAKQVAARVHDYLSPIVRDNPNHLDAWTWGGLVHFAAAQYERAVNYFARASELLPKERQAWLNLARAQEQAEQLAAATFSSWHALTLGLDIELLENLAILYKNQDKVQEALSAYQWLQQESGGHTQFLWEEALLHLLNGNYVRGWEMYNDFRWIDHKNGRTQFEHPLTKEALIGNLEGKTIFITSDQGLGDVILFSRYLPLLRAKGARIWLSAPSALARMFESQGLVDRFLHEGHDEGEAVAQTANFMCLLGSLPGLFGTTLDNIPSMPLWQPPAECIKRYAKMLPRRSGLRVGVVWSGNPIQKTDVRRSMSLSTLRTLTDAHPEIQWFNLQKQVRESDLADLRASQLIDYSPDWSDYADTASLISQLDLVISTCTSGAHMAAALGKPTWVLLSYVADWRWLRGRSDSPWFPTVRLFRQNKPKDWAGVLGEVSQALVDFRPPKKSRK